MFIRKKTFIKILEEYGILCLQSGFKLGEQMGRMQAGDKGIIISGKAIREIEEIMKKEEL